jgi:hypothetical protein
MRFKRSFGLLLAIAVLGALIVINVVSRREPGLGQSVSAASGLDQVCLSDNEVSGALRTLSSGIYADQQKAMDLLTANANRATVCRTHVITSLMSAMDQPNLDLTGGTPQFFLWHYGTRLLGELKAVEALDLLISNFELHDGTPFPLNHHPALGGVIDMGEVALPKLETTLSRNPDRYTRRYAVFCIALIGGQSASQILNEALKSETDPCVTSCINASLKAFNNKRRPHQISDEMRTTWYTTFLCNGE